MLIPAQYPTTPVPELLEAAEYGRAALDQRFLRALLANMPAVVRYANEHPDTDLLELMLHLFCFRPAADALPFLTFVAREFREDMPEELLEALARLGRPAIEPLLALWEEYKNESTELPTALAFLHAPDPRIEAVFATMEPGDAAFLTETMNEPFDIGEFDLFSLYPQEAAPQMRLLPIPERLELLESSDRFFRLAATASFLDTELRPEHRAPLYQVARHDADPEIRGIAWETLEPFLEDKALLGEMGGLLTGPATHPLERAGLAVALAQKQDTPGWRATVETLYKDRTTRARALQAMWRSFDRTFGAMVSRSLHDEDRDIREQAILAAGYLNLSGDASRLEELFESEEDREDALFAYALCCPAEVTRARIRQLFHKIETLAGGLSTDEGAIVEQALDLRLEMHGLPAAFATEADGEAEDLPAEPPAEKPGRNDPCPCGSGKKYKKCHGA